MMTTNKKMLMTAMTLVMLGLGMTSLAVLKNVVVLVMYTKLVYSVLQPWLGRLAGSSRS